MEIFYLKKSEFLKSINFKTLELFSDGKVYSNETKYTDHLLGLFLTKFVARNIYHLKDTGFEIIDKKPFFKSRELYFSISHSKDIVMVVFDNKDIGADVEFVCERQNFQDILDRYNQKIENPTLSDFYRFWTLYESQIKLKNQYKSSITGYVENDYMYSCVSDSVLISACLLKKIVCTGENVDLTTEILEPKNCKIILSVE